MASFVKRGKSVRVFIDLKGVRDNKTLESMGAARVWANQRESEILAGDRGEIPDKTLGDLLTRYARDVSPSKKGARWEAVRLGLLLRDPIARVNLAALDGTHVAQWRDRRLAGYKAGDEVRKPVAQATVRREWNLLSSACSVALSEWKWLRINPFSKAVGVKRPKNANHRTALFQPSDIETLRAHVAAHPILPNVRVLRVLEFAIETAMRDSEILFLGDHPGRVNEATRVAHLPDTKNGSAREVGMSERALELWREALAEDLEPGRNRWGLTSATRDQHWRALRKSVGLDHFHFHDTRHTAITRMAKKLSVPALARTTGHKNLNELMTYYNESAEDIARLL